MYWLYQDALLHTSGNKQRCAAIIGALYFQENDVANARDYLNEVLAYKGVTLKANAFDRIYELRETEKNHP